MVTNFRAKKKYTVSDLAAGVLSGNRVMLSQAITLIESTRPDHRAMAYELVELCLPFAGQSIRIGVTGTPGVGKSSFIEYFGNHVTKKDKKIAVLAIDPSSQISRGSILGDKTRMMQLALNPMAYIRPTAAAGSLGGVAQKTRETIILCESAGYDVIIIETVGVGQSETAVYSMTDFFLLLLQPGAGDELQGIKRGIVEMADLIAVNKADGGNENLAKNAQLAYQNALHLFPLKESNWIPQVVCSSALSGLGMENIWSLICDYQQFTIENKYFQQKRKQQNHYWLHESLRNGLLETFFSKNVTKLEFSKIEKAVESGQISPFRAAEMLLHRFFEKK